MKLIHYFNGDYVTEDQVKISVNNVGFLRAYSVFEFFKVKGATPIFMEDHLDRLFRSAQGLNMDLPKTKTEIEQIIQVLIEKNELPYSSIKIILNGGDSVDGYTPGEPQLILLNKPFQDLADSLYQKGASLMTYQYQRDLPKIKSTYYAQSVALRKEFMAKGHADVLYTHNGYISEASRSSLFLVKNEEVYSSEYEVLDGVTRKHVIQAIQGDFKVHHTELQLKDLFEADEAFITSTSKKVLPIVKVDDQNIGTGNPGALTQRVMQLFEEYLVEYVDQAAASS